MRMDNSQIAFIPTKEYVAGTKRTVPLRRLLLVLTERYANTKLVLAGVRIVPLSISSREQNQ